MEKEDENNNLNKKDESDINNKRINLEKSK
jgi:hypothetical protein